MKKPAFLIILIFQAFIAFSQLAEQERTAEQANQSYSNGDFETAISLYESVVDAGYESSGLYFNLGNAYFKMNNIPAAILYYEKARKLDPADENILFNLELANSRIVDKMEPLPEFFLKSWWKSVRNLLTSDQWAKAGIISFVFLLITASVFIVSRATIMRKLSFYSGLVFLVIMIVSFVFSISSYRDYSRKSSAIIFTPTVTVKSSPNESSVDLFVIHEGTKVLIMDHVEGWTEVRLANGNVGWIRSETFRSI